MSILLSKDGKKSHQRDWGGTRVLFCNYVVHVILPHFGLTMIWLFAIISASQNSPLYSDFILLPQTVVPEIDSCL